MIILYNFGVIIGYQVKTFINDMFIYHYTLNYVGVEDIQWQISHK